MSTVVTFVGFIAIVLALRDVFHTVLHPSGHGSLTGNLQLAVWRVFRASAGRRPALLALAGPVAMVVTLAAWTALLAIGWALVLWSHLPQRFLLATGLNPADQDGFLDALYVSLVSLATLGYGDIAPRADWLRILVPLEAFVGFALMTAAISWILSVYPVLARRRSLARQITLLCEAERAVNIAALELDASAAAPLLADLTARLVAVQGDLAQFPVTYYFHTGDERAALPATMRDLLHLAESAASPDCPPAVRLQGTMLERAIQDFVAEIGPRFLDLPTTPADDVLRAYAADHLYEYGRVTP